MKGFGLNIIKEAKEMAAKLEKVKSELMNKTVTATVGGGMVTVVANGQQQIVKISLEREIINPDDVELLEDLLLSGTNEALRKSVELAAEEMSKITGGLKIPGLSA
ncbi:YbaB/EbfC family nucleoid-associated protein [candidate division CSSED10-310 bacterium]|uniref:Nucleoid-associated protein ACFL27_25050 n=1 Tax=candidate division CSSED10-310 bacterium TaxID=2855610 RepID=A0ABV6Z4W7_UNCC1